MKKLRDLVDNRLLDDHNGAWTWILGFVPNAAVMLKLQSIASWISWQVFGCGIKFLLGVGGFSSEEDRLKR